MGDTPPREVKPDRQENSPGPDDPTIGGNGGRPEPDQLKRRTPWNTLSARVISFVSRKGGVGKTTSAVNLGAALALSGHSVLLVGTDPQCGVSRSLGYGQEDLKGGLQDIFTDSAPLTDLVHTTPLTNLFFVSPNIWSLADEVTFNQLMESQVDAFVREIDRARNLYDTILIDCPPHLNPATRAALVASQSYLVPIQAEELCRDSLDRLLSFIQSFQDEVYAETDLSADPQSSPPLRLEGMFLTMVTSRTRMSRHVCGKVRQDYPEIIFENFIPRTTRLTEMALRGKPAVIYDRKSPGSRAYFHLMDELVTRFIQRNGGRETDDGPATLAAGERPADDLLRSPGNQAEPTLPDLPEKGLDRLLAELKSAIAEAEQSLAPPAEPEALELVSLDDVLAEEEGKSRRDADWEE